MIPGPIVMMIGISGVGKSHLTRLISERRPDLLCFSAGALLKKTLEADPEQLRTASHDVILANQILLPEVLRRARGGRWQQTVLLEAHSIIDNDRELIDVPLGVVLALEISGIILVEEHAAEIKRRRESDQRPRPTRNLIDLENQQQLSARLADKYADALSAPLRRVSSDDVHAALDFIAKVEIQTSF